MAFDRLNYDPPTGHLEFPNPQTGQQAREQLQTLHDQTRDIINALEDQLESISGASQIGATGFDGGTSTIQSIFNELNENKAELSVLLEAQQAILGLDTGKAEKSEVYSKTETYNKTEVDGKIGNINLELQTIGETNANVEVANAHYSTLKNKTFVDINSRFNEIESDHQNHLDDTVLHISAEDRAVWNSRAMYMSGMDTFASGLTYTVTNTFITVNTLVTISPTSGKAGNWVVDSADGSFTITSDSAETNVTFDWFAVKGGA